MAAGEVISPVFRGAGERAGAAAAAPLRLRALRAASPHSLRLGGACRPVSRRKRRDFNRYGGPIRPPGPPGGPLRPGGGGPSVFPGFAPGASFGRCRLP